MRTGSLRIPVTLPLPGGDFLMGDDNGPLTQRPAHRVTISPVSFGVYPVCREEYACFLQATGSDPPPTWEDPIFSCPKQPVVAVTWSDAVAYSQWLSSVTGMTWRLPTEAEREYAARGGREGLRYPWGDEYPSKATAYDLRAWNAPLEVGTGAPNGFGLYNMADTVHEWCLDWYGQNAYADSPEENPRGPGVGIRRVARGGAWRHQVPVSSCAHRTSLPPDRRFTDFGFRVVCEPF